MNEQKREFKCDRCGACCRTVGLIEEAKFLDRGDGVCKYLTDNNLCSIYDFRPEICRVDKMYKRYKDKMTWDEYLELSYEACEELRTLEKEKDEYIVDENIDDKDYIE